MWDLPLLQVPNILGRGGCGWGRLNRTHLLSEARGRGFLCLKGSRFNFILMWHKQGGGIFPGVPLLMPW